MRVAGTKCVLLCFLIPYILLIGAQSDFEMAEKAYKQGMYGIAQSYFEHLLQGDPLNPRVPDAIYYLIKICDERGDFIDVIYFANQFLAHHTYDHRCQEVFDFLLERLSEKKSYTLAYEYIKKYDYFATNYSLLETIGYGLIGYKQYDLGDDVLSLCPQTDTIKIVRARLQSDPERKTEILRTIGGIRGDIYLIEHNLTTGDTIAAYEIYQKIPNAQVTADLVYRFTKIALLFEKTIVKEFASRLDKGKGFSNKRILLEALATGHLTRKITPEDEEEMNLLFQISEIESVSTLPPENVDVDSLLLYASDSKTYSNYYLDSAYCERLIGEDRTEEADKILSGYFRYANVRDYVRTVRARKYFKDKNYHKAMTEIILSQCTSPEILFMFAECSKELGKDPTVFYAAVVNSTADTVLSYRALEGLIESEFANGNYSAIIEYTVEDLRNDTMLIRLYVKSLARTGQQKRADVIFSTYFSGVDYDVANYYGEFLLQSKNYQSARHYYDSLVSGANGNVPESVYYNWALIPFLQGEIDTARARFNLYITHFENTKNYYKALFKIATIHYAQEYYDSAGYYYSRASIDSSLQLAALQNQVICYKKAAYWDGVIEAGSQILEIVDEDEEANVRFDIGYALLRVGKPKYAIEQLDIAARRVSIPEHYYWLGEAYLAKGDLVEAFYQYQKIVDVFPQDDMWYPTALYKTGIILELIDDLEAARKVYEKMIKVRGLGDIWGAEAQQRLEKLEGR
jgi:TolA-binding protein